MHLCVPKVEVGDGRRRLRLPDGCVGCVERGLGGGERGLGRVALGGLYAALVGCGETGVVSLRTVDLGLRDDNPRLGARDLGAAQVLCRKVLLGVYLKKEVPFLDLGAFRKADAEDVAVDLRQDVRRLDRLRMAYMLGRRIKRRAFHHGDADGRRFRGSRFQRLLPEADRLAQQISRRYKRSRREGRYDACFHVQQLSIDIQYSFFCRKGLTGRLRDGN